MPTLKTIKEAALDRLNECSEVISKHFLQAVRPIYGVAEGRNVPALVGTSFLLHLDGRPFLVSAAHVIDESAHSNLYVGGDQGLVPIEGTWLATDKPNGDRAKDKYDFGYLALSPKLVDEIGPVKYIAESELSKNRGSTFGRIYQAMGYPASRNSRIDITARSVPAKAWIYNSPASQIPQLAKDWNVSGEDHIFVGYDKKHSLDTRGARINSIKVRGASGGVLLDLGLVSIPSNLPPDTKCTGYLAGVLIENPQRHSAIVAIKIGIVVDQIRKRPVP